VLPPAPKPPPKPAANKREEAAERRAFAKSEQAAGVIPSKPAVVETKVLRVAGAASVAQGRRENEENVGRLKGLFAPISYDPPWLEKIKEKLEDVKKWTQDHVIQPAKTAWNTITTAVKNTVSSTKEWVQDAYNRTVTAVKDFAVNTVVAVQNKYEQVKKDVIQKWSDAKAWVNNKVVKPVQETNKKGWSKWATITADIVLALTMPAVYFGVGFSYGFPPVSIALGNSPEDRGIRIAEQYEKDILKNAGETDPTVIAASIAVQSQWNVSPLDYLLAGADYILNGKNASPSFGIAQLSQEQLDAWEIDGTPFQASASIQGMAHRIEDAVDNCQKCNDTDKLIVAAIAQNGGVNPKDIGSIIKEYRDENEIDWEAYFRKQEPLNSHPWSDWFNNFRAGEQNYNTQYMLRLFTNDMTVLVEEEGWAPPPGYDPAYLQCLANGDEDCTRANP